MRNIFLISATTLALASLAAAQPGPLAYAFGFKDLVNGPTYFGVLDIGTGSFYRTVIDAKLAQGIARDARGQIYIVDEKASLLRLTPGNFKTTLVGSTGVTTPSPTGISVEAFTSLANGDLFLLDFANRLYSVNPDTGAATLIGSTGIPSITHFLFGVSFTGNCDSLFFTLAEADENFNVVQPPALYRIDPRTAATTRVGPVPRAILGSAWIEGKLYAFTLDTRVFGGGSEGPHVLTIDPATGAATVVGDLNFPSIAGAVRFTGTEAGQCKNR